MVKNAIGEDHYDEMAEPPQLVIDDTHPLSKNVKAALKEIYDPEIPVNIYELGLIYKITFKNVENELSELNEYDVSIDMSLTSPACPVAQEMPSWVQNAVFPLQGVRHVDVEIVWDPTWDPSMMAETAKLQLNMFT
ncbi:MAG: PaaD protein [Alphaproteobacteria bacterium]|nr:PaaD protein [Alphaproteobacteria bacterium]